MKTTSRYTPGLLAAAISIISIVYCALLLWFSSKVKVNSHNPQDGTTGHVWDENLQEMNNPLPRWWLWLFIIRLVRQCSSISGL